MKMRSINIGLMGHVDAGKTSITRKLVKDCGALASTASLDSNPQSALRNITLDLGFLGMKIPTAEGEVSVGLVDAPGHASLLRTVLRSTPIIDAIMIVLDGTKGIQQQTKECLQVAELATETMIVVLNKIDLLEPSVAIKRVASLREKVFRHTKFGAQVPIIPFSCVDDTHPTTELIEAIQSIASAPPQRRPPDGPLFMPFDHSFLIKGHGCVVSGTVLSGTLTTGMEVHVPNHGATKIRSMESYKETITEAPPGTRVAVCLRKCPKLDRNVLVDSSSVGRMSFYARLEPAVLRSGGPVLKNGGRYTVAVGTHAVLSQMDFFGIPKISEFSPKDEFKTVIGMSYERALFDDDSIHSITDVSVYARLTFSEPIHVPESCPFIIFSDSHVHRILMGGRLLPYRGPLTLTHTSVGTRGWYMRIQELEAIVDGLFKNAAHVRTGLGHEVYDVDKVGEEIDVGDVKRLRGTVERPFGSRGRCVVRLKDSDGIKPHIVRKLTKTKILELT